MATDEGWLPLEEAIEAFADPELWRAYREAPAPPPRPMSGWLDQPFRGRDRTGRDPFRFDERARPADPSANARRRALDALVADFRSRLVSRELVATGVEAVESLTYVRKAIPAPLWSRLRMNVEKSRARLGNLTIVDIEVRRAAPTAVHPLDQASTGGPPPVMLTPSVKRRGRPSIKDRLIEEMRRRAEAGELEEGVGAEARALRNWAERNVQGQKIPREDSIEDAIRDLYRDLRSGKK